jgi:hypothetical protein
MLNASFKTATLWAQYQRCPVDAGPYNKIYSFHTNPYAGIGCLAYVSVTYHSSTQFKPLPEFRLRTSLAPNYGYPSPEYQRVTPACPWGTLIW